MWFYEVKLHTLGRRQHKTLPLPKLMQFMPTSHHDRKVSEKMLLDVSGLDLFEDKAYINATWQADISANQQIIIIIPTKLIKGRSTLIPRIRINTKLRYYDI